MSVVRFAPAIHTPKPRVQVSQVIGGLAASLDLNAEPGSYAITGTEATLARGLFINAEPGTYAVTGTDATLVTERPLNAESGAYTITGSDATLARGLFLNAESGSYAITGSDATLEYVQPVVIPTVLRATKSHTPKKREQVSQAISGLAPAATTNYELDAQPGAYTITGVEAQLVYETPTTWDRVVAPNYAHTTPQIIYGSRLFGGVSIGYELAADHGTYNIFAPGANLLADYSLNAQPGAYTITGVAAELVHTTVGAYEINAEPGSYVVTGANATLVAARVLSADPGGYTITGFTADLVYLQPGAYTINADPGSYVLTGVDATLAAARLFTADPGSFSVTGIAAGLALERVVLADPGAFTISGTANAMLLTRVLGADSGSYVITGEAAGLGDPIVLGFFDQPTPSTDGFDTGPSAGVFDSPTPGVVRT